MTDSPDNETASKLQQWFHQPERKELQASVASLLELASAVMMENAYEGALQNVNVMIPGKKKRISFRGYSHHVRWERCDIVEFFDKYGISSTGRFVAKSRLVGVPDGHGDHVIKGSVFTMLVGQPYFTAMQWYACAVEDLPDRVLRPLETALERYVSD